MTYSDDKYYKIRLKNGAHINERINEDGSRSALQFDSSNNLQGPVDLIEVDVTAIAPTNQQHPTMSYKEHLLLNVIEPSIEEGIKLFITSKTELALENVSRYLWDLTKTKAIPAIKRGYTKVKLKIQNFRNPIDKGESIATANYEEIYSYANYHTSSEKDQIIRNIQLAALYIASQIRELSNMASNDFNVDPDAKKMYQQIFEELTSKHITSTMDFLLSEQNRDYLDATTIAVIKSFKTIQSI